MAKYTKESLIQIVAESQTMAEVIRRLNMASSSSGHLKLQCQKWDISTTHFLSQSEHTRKMWADGAYSKTLPIEAVFVEHRASNRRNLKNRLYALGIKKRECEMCGQTEMWQGQSMTLILDHVNGVRDDNRLENLRILCPNCNATLPTHCGKKNSGSGKPRICEWCGGLRKTGKRFCSIQCRTQAFSTLSKFGRKGSNL